MPGSGHGQAWQRIGHAIEEELDRSFVPLRYLGYVSGTRMFAIAGSHAGWRRGRSDNLQTDRSLAPIAGYPKSGRWLSILAGALNGAVVSICMGAE